MTVKKGSGTIALTPAGPLKAVAGAAAALPLFNINQLVAGRGL